MHTLAFGSSLCRAAQPCSLPAELHPLHCYRYYGMQRVLRSPSGEVVALTTGERKQMQNLRRSSALIE